MLNKKKNKRVHVRRAMDDEQAVRRHRFYESGAALSLLMLIGYILLLGWMLIPAPNPFRLPWPELRKWLLLCGLLGLTSLVFGLYIAAYEPRLVKNHLRGGLLLSMLLVMLALIRLFLYQDWPPLLTLIPIMITTITMTIAYNQRTAIGVSAYLTLCGMIILVHFPPGYYSALPVLLAAGCSMTVTALCLREIRTRSKLIEVSALAAIITFVVVGLSGLWLYAIGPEKLRGSEIVLNCLWASAGTFVAGLLLQALLPIVEKLFRTATNLTLLDYSEASKPLLKRLALEAPGTFNHSWQLGILAEAAAEAIGANGLLTRVGCYYHDIGKLNKPRYFVENQAELMNQHRELSPTMSKIIIFGHVKDGLELAREYRLPKVLWQFIATHHGTTLIKYFFHEAMKKAEESNETVNEIEFRYPGPKPATREAAIVMLTDAVEGATRAMQEPTPNRIETVVHQLAMERLQDGQFDECDLTMKDLNRIEASLVKSLCGVYHTRIAYPKLEKK